MLLGQSLQTRPILSLQIGTQIGVANTPIINPNNLKIEGWWASSQETKSEKILVIQDIRDILSKGFVVNDYSSLTDPSELIRLKPILEIGFELNGKIVYTEGKKRLGKVVDYAMDKDSFFIQKIYVGQSIVKSFSGGSLIVDRSQIIEVTRKKITVKEATEPGKVLSSEAVIA